MCGSYFKDGLEQALCGFALGCKQTVFKICLSFYLYYRFYSYFKAGDPSTYLNVVQYRNTFSAWCFVRVWKAKGQSLKCHSLCAVPGLLLHLFIPLQTLCICEEFFLLLQCADTGCFSNRTSVLWLSFFLLALQPCLASTGLHQSSAHQAGSSASVKELVF